MSHTLYSDLCQDQTEIRLHLRHTIVPIQSGKEVAFRTRDTADRRVDYACSSRIIVALKKLAFMTDHRGVRAKPRVQSNAYLPWEIRISPEKRFNPSMENIKNTEIQRLVTFKQSVLDRTIVSDSISPSDSFKEGSPPESERSTCLVNGEVKESC